MPGEDGKPRSREFRVGILGGENTQDRLKSYDGFRNYWKRDWADFRVKLFPAADYAGVMQGIAAGRCRKTAVPVRPASPAQLDYGCVEPVIVLKKDGSTCVFRDGDTENSGASPRSSK